MHNLKATDVAVEHSPACGHSFDFMCVEWWCVPKASLGWLEMDTYSRMEWVVHCGRIPLLFLSLTFYRKNETY